MRCVLRARWPATVGLILIVTAVSAVVLTFAAGARRTSSAPDRYTAAVGGAFDGLIFQEHGRPRTAEIAALPGASSAASITFVFGALTTEGNADVDAIAFALQGMEHHFVEAGTYVANRLPARAAIVTVKYSGSVHYYSGRPALAWDTLDAATLEPAFTFLRDQGYEPYLLLATEEEPTFRERFKTAGVAGGLDWPPIARIGRAARVYDPRDRARFLAGEVVETEEVGLTPRKGRRR